VFPQILKYTKDSPDFYFDSINQIRMDLWSKGRVVLLGDAGYAVSLATGQGTSVAMIAAYVLAGELAAHSDEPLAGLRSYEHELRDYVLQNQELAAHMDLPEPEPSDDTEGADAMIDPDSLPDFGEQAVPFDLRSYEHLSGGSGDISVVKTK
jgi:2-polyprenyl-6-methoxyphenol hydroxylase-like FAD-dependent oxidoreductase